MEVRPPVELGSNIYTENKLLSALENDRSMIMILYENDTKSENTKILSHPHRSVVYIKRETL